MKFKLIFYLLAVTTSNTGLRDRPFDIQRGGLGFFLMTSFFSFCTTSYFSQKETATSFSFFENNNTLKSENCKNKSKTLNENP